MDPYAEFGEQWEAGSSEDEQTTYHPANCLQGTQHLKSHVQTLARERTLTFCPLHFICFSCFKATQLSRQSA